MKLIDTHCHVHFNAYKEDAAEVIQRSFDNGVWMVTVGTQKDTSRTGVEWASKYKEGLYATVGLHPTHSIAHGFNDDQELDFKPRAETFDPKVYEEMLSDKVVGVGECGLDYYRLPEDKADQMKKTQLENFMAQAKFAANHKLPLVVHCRDAYQDQRRALDEAFQDWGEIKGVMHCFTGTYEEAKLFLDLGWYISFSGIATFADAVGEVAAKVPLEQMLVETDAPYLTPPPHRGKRNEPSNVEFVARNIAERRKSTFEEIAMATTKNARKLFKI